jgi:membrane protease YdiL (CAAX protease family)
VRIGRPALAIAGVIFALGFPGFPISWWFDEFADVGHLVGYEAIWWGAVAVLFAYVHVAEQLPLAAVGVRTPRVRDIGLGVATGIVILVGLVAIYYVVLPALRLDEQQPVDQLLAMPLWWRVMSVVRAAVGEEIMFRGYAIERIESLTGSSRVAGLVTCSVFTVEHLGYWGWGHLLVAGFAGTLLTLLYLRRRNLWVNIVAHFIVDGVAILTG